jgi:hypothetical protein
MSYWCHGNYKGKCIVSLISPRILRMYSPLYTVSLQNDMSPGRMLFYFLFRFTF